MHNRSFVYTDPDVVPIGECPDDAFAYWDDLLKRYPDVCKVGPGLRIDDLPGKYAYRNRVRRYEKKFWKDEVEPGVFRAPIDTTLALYRSGTTELGFDALRTGYPYIARHLTWYIDSQNPGPDERFYAQRMARGSPDSPDTSSWCGATLHPSVLDRLAQGRYWSRFESRVILRTRLRRTVGRIRSLSRFHVPASGRRGIGRGPDFVNRSCPARRRNSTPVQKPTYNLSVIFDELTSPHPDQVDVAVRVRARAASPFRPRFDSRGTGETPGSLTRSPHDVETCVETGLRIHQPRAEVSKSSWHRPLSHHRCSEDRPELVLWREKSLPDPARLGAAAERPRLDARAGSPGCARRRLPAL